MPLRTIGTNLRGVTFLKNMHLMWPSCPSEHGPDSPGKAVQKMQGQPVWFSLRLVDVSQHEIDTSLVFTSTTVLPGYSEYWPERGPWCFYDDVQAVKIKLDEFNVIGDEEAKQSWIKKRQSIIRAREQRCEPLKKWLQRLEMEREAELGRRRLARQEEIETRLKELGHDERDIDFQDSNESFILVHNTKPLTNKAWGKLLPKLLKVIKANRRERIKSEREDRSMRIADWAWDICGPKVFSLCEQHDNEGRSLNATKILIDKLESQPKVKLLLDKERSDNEFERDFESQKSELGDFLTNWVNEQEARLVSMMPSDTPTADFDSLGSYPTMAFRTHVDLTRVPMTALPINTQRLLRADAIFTRGGKLGHPSTGSNICYFYPDFDTLPEAFTYSSTASEIASNLLTCLGRPNASYLEMTSGGYALHCGICPETRSLGWKDMIEHCLNEHWDPEPEGIPNI
ncbi:hypothetical protein OPQ81_003586 [Rhizoctonia solani]|nr:hypothetical protein OPQ81_003586 [Rhizoctonia solani]